MSSCCVNAVHMTIGVRLVSRSSLSSWQMSYPLRPGSIRSSITRSGLCCRTQSAAAVPSPSVVEVKSICLRTATSRSASMASSSTIRAVLLKAAPSQESRLFSPKGRGQATGCTTSHTNARSPAPNQPHAERRQTDRNEQNPEYCKAEPEKAVANPPEACLKFPDDAGAPYDANGSGEIPQARPQHPTAPIKNAQRAAKNDYRHNRNYRDFL